MSNLNPTTWARNSRSLRQLPLPILNTQPPTPHQKKNNPSPSSSYPCTLCELSSQPDINHVAVPTIRDARSLPPSPSTPALVVIGQNPGHLEDVHNTPFIGPSGSHARTTYTEAPGFLDLTSLYFTSLYRCKTPRSDDNPTARWIKPCRDTHLLYDLKRIHKVHSYTTLLLLGGAPTKWVYDLFHLGKPSLKQAFLTQGQVASAHSMTVRLFSTYHPAYILRDNRHILAVKDHLALLSDFLQGVATSPPVVTRVPVVPLSEWRPHADR